MSDWILKLANEWASELGQDVEIERRPGYDPLAGEDPNYTTEIVKADGEALSAAGAGEQHEATGPQRA